MKSEIEADGFITPERYTKGSKPIEKKMTGRDVVLLTICSVSTQRSSFRSI